MKAGMKFMVFISITCLIVAFPVFSAYRANQGDKEAEGAEALPLLSSDAASPSSDPSAPAAEDAMAAADETSPGPPPSYGPDTMIPCTAGLMAYYNQSDPRWADADYGPGDPMKAYGCGPTALAMVIQGFTGRMITPLEVAQWASANGYCSRGEGSLHSLIPEGLANYGLIVNSMSDRSVDAVLSEIRSGKIVIALMSKGYFTEKGHFLLLTQVTDDGQLRIADPANWENTTKTWDPEFILGQLRGRADAGGPLWSVSQPAEY